MKTEKKIFVGIPSYRDSELIPTLIDLFKKSENKSRIVVGICLQDDEKMMNPNLIYEQLIKDSILKDVEECKKQIRVDFVDWIEAKGPCWARHRFQKLYEEEEYYLAIDSHMRFCAQWDSKLIELLEKCENPTKSIITAYPSGYELPNNIPTDSRISFLCFKEFGKDEMIRFTGKVLTELPNQNNQPISSFFWVSGFSFSKGEVIKQVPYDPHLPFLFFGEEISMTLRLWTHGYDFYCPPFNVVFHLWERNYRPNFREVHRISQNGIFFLQI